METGLLDDRNSAPGSRRTSTYVVLSTRPHHVHDPILPDHGIVPPVYQFLYVRCLENTLVIQSLSACIIMLSDAPTYSGYHVAAAPTIVILLLQIMQLLVVCGALHHTFHMLLHEAPSVKRIGQTYLSITIGFAGFHLVLMCLGWSRYVIQVVDNGDGVISVFHLEICFLYYSIATMSSTGFGDIHAIEWPGQLVAALQMILATLYNIGIFAIVCSHFQDQEHRLPKSANFFQRGFKCIRSNISGRSCSMC
uniref:Potassium channel domain-containing protein n=1 Tax=Spongospora subterranea TaxID=70186 RepID=A0A0H5QK48_9EUKA|eukprot:CRZ01691.1 hypothetical protein [Spongospora subterranea]